MRSLFIIITIFFLMWADLSAQAPTHTVRDGETLFSISRSYDITVEQLREWNNLPNNVIHAGQVLVVGTGGRSAAERPIERPALRQLQPTGETIIHTVEAGQTLFRLSRMYDVTIEDIKKWNDLRNNVISIGQKLVIRPAGDVSDMHTDAAQTTSEERLPDSQRQTETQRQPMTQNRPALDHPADAEQDDSEQAASEQAALERQPIADLPTTRVEDGDTADVTASTPEEQIGTFGARETAVFYEVRPGDTLYRIAAQFNMTLDELMEYNKLESSRILVGQQLRIRSWSAAPPSVTQNWDFSSTPQGRFVTHSMGSEDALDQLLRHHGMDMHEFRALNPGMSPGDVRPGDEVTLLIAATAVRNNPYLVTQADESGTLLEVTRYPEGHLGKTTTSGDLYNPGVMTAAHPAIPLGSVIFVTNPENGHGVFVYVNDRTTENRLQLSESAFAALRFYDSTRLVAKIVALNDN